MLLKRKRSEDELSCFGSGGVDYSSPMRSDHGDVMMMDTESCSPISPSHISAFSPNSQNRSRSCTPSHLPSRTFKRHRNGRPSDQEVHQNTLKMLYQAQQQPQQPHHVFSPPASTASMPSMPPPQAPTQNQPSLHNFWKLPRNQPSSSHSPTPSSAVSMASAPCIDMVNRPTSCEDCGVGLSEEDTMMDDGYGFETYINVCSACSRAVCFSCSVSNLGEQRQCLNCAGRDRVGKEKIKKWVGGVGWTSGGVTAC
ncbi:hypothetical protein N0V82_005805 [Gnomoniopsis sp. IMI 355080]|nr:hypothetical protein N0V82_005805 [Gnomoniopsis sp. IMI 355080]